MISNNVVVLRAVEHADVDLLYKWENDMELWPVSNTLRPFSRAQIERYVKNAALDVYQTKQLRLMIDTAEEGETVGMIDMFDFDPFHSRAGLGMCSMPMAPDLLSSSFLFVNSIQYSGLHQLYCNITASNTPSLNLLNQEVYPCRVKRWLKTTQGLRMGLYQLLAGNKSVVWHDLSRTELHRCGRETWEDPNRAINHVTW